MAAVISAANVSAPKSWDDWGAWRMVNTTAPVVSDVWITVGDLSIEKYEARPQPDTGEGQD